MISSGLYLDRIPYARTGDSRDPIIVLNGGQAFMRKQSPERLQRDLSRIGRILPKGRDFELIGYDTEPGPSHSLTEVVSDLKRILAVQGPRQVVAISYGGIVGTRLAAESPDLVRDLVLVSSAHKFSPAGRGRIEQQISMAAAGQYDQLADSYRGLFRRPWFNMLLNMRLNLSGHRAAQDFAPSDTITRSLSAVLDENLMTKQAHPEAISARLLVLGGTKDQFFGDGVMDELARAAPCATIKMFERETHMLAVERSREVAEILAAFLEGHRSGCA